MLVLIVSILQYGNGCLSECSHASHEVDSCSSERTNEIDDLRRDRPHLARFSELFLSHAVACPDCQVFILEIFVLPLISLSSLRVVPSINKYVRHAG